MAETLLETSRLQALEEIFSGTSSESERLGSFLARFGGDQGWLNPDFDWTSAEKQELLYQLLLRELERDAHLGGEPTPPGEHTGIVQLLADFGTYLPSMETVGSGVRVGERLVLTAKHVVTNAAASELRFTGLPDGARAFGFGDAGVVLSDEADVAALVFDALPGTSGIVPIAAPEEITETSRYRSVGFGMTEKDRATQFYKNHLDGMIIHSLACQANDDPVRFLCRPGKEIVAGAVNGKAYHNDSGGGLLVKSGDVWKLVGIIGGNSLTAVGMAARYTRVDAVRDELNRKLEDAGHPTF